MKKILPLALSFCGAALLIGSLVAANTAPAPAPAAPAPMAAAPKPGPGPGDHLREMIGKKLGLTDEQRKKLEAIRTEQRAALDAVRDDKALSPQDKRARARGLMESFRGQMKTVLTAEQQKKMEQIRERLMNRRQNGRHGFAGARGGSQGFGPGPQGFGFGPQPGPQGFRPSGPMEMIQQGNRMAEEGQQMLARQLGLSAEQSAKLRDLVRQHQEKAQVLQKEFHDQMQGVLTPEQQARAKEMHEHEGRGGEGPDRGPGRGRPGSPPDMPPPGK